MAGIEREELEAQIKPDTFDKEILRIIDEVCPGAFITNRQRLELVKKLSSWGEEICECGREA